MAVVAARPPLTCADVRALATIIDAAETGAVCEWVSDAGDEMQGVARRLITVDGDRLGVDDDVRDATLVITQTVADRWLPVADVIALISRHEFVTGTADRRTNR